MAAKRVSVDTFKKQLGTEHSEGHDRFRFGGDDVQYPIMEIGIDTIDVETQVRIEFDETDLEDLCKSIQRAKELGVPYGLLQPVLVSVKDPIFKRYKLEVGERRFRAFKKLGERTIPAIVIGQDKSVNSYLIQLYENVHRKNLHIIEKAHGVMQYALVEIAKQESFRFDGDIKDLVRTTVTKLNFKRKLDDAEQAVAVILDALRIPVSTLRSWFYATSFPEDVQKFFIQNKVPVSLIQKYGSLAKNPAEETIEVFKKELGIGNKISIKEKKNILAQTKLDRASKYLERFISTIKKDGSVNHVPKEKLTHILALAKELQQLAADNRN